MKILPFLAFSAIIAAPVFAEETRQLGSHEHGVSTLDIAFNGSQIAMELHAPGADIVGFEYIPKSADDIAKVDAAVLALGQPLDLFTLPEAAQCSVIEAKAELESEDDHEDHGHDAHAKDGHDDHAHGEHDHDDHADAAGHTEFHAEYLLECDTIAAVTEMSFAYFDAFPNALEVEVQVISATGATAFEVERDAPMLDLSGLN